MKALYVILIAVVFTLGCAPDHCENFVTYEERFPLYTVTNGEYIFNTYIVYEDVMSSCDCLLLANERAKSYRLFLEGLELDSDEFEFHSFYPSYYSCG